VIERRQQIDPLPERDRVGIVVTDLVTNVAKQGRTRWYALDARTQRDLQERESVARVGRFGPDSHGGSTGSNPVGGASKRPAQYGCLSQELAPGAALPPAWHTSSHEGLKEIPFGGMANQGLGGHRLGHRQAHRTVRDDQVAEQPQGRWVIPGGKSVGNFVKSTAWSNIPPARYSNALPGTVRYGWQSGVTGILRGLLGHRVVVP